MYPATEHEEVKILDPPGHVNQLADYLFIFSVGFEQMRKIQRQCTVSQLDIGERFFVL